MSGSADSDPDIIDLRRGYPSPELLPVDEVRAAVAGLTDARARAVLAYGPGSGPEELRSELARFLSERYGHPVTAEELVLASGISLNLAMVCQLFAPAGSTVVCEDPTYFHACNVFRSAAATVHPVPVDQHGMRVDVLERALEEGLAPRLVYCIPTFHNPTAVDLAPERARRLLELAQAHDFLIVADEPYNLLHFDEGPPPCMMSYDRGAGRVISLGSFSKLVAPGLRTGWVHAHPTLVARFLDHGALRSGGCLNQLGFAVIEHALASGFLAENIDRLRRIYGDRAQAMSRALTEHFGGHAFRPARGGYFFWLALDAPRSPEYWLEVTDRYGVTVMPGSQCAVALDARDHVRLCIAYQPRERIVEGVERLARALAGSAGHESSSRT